MTCRHCETISKTVCCFCDTPMTVINTEQLERVEAENKQLREALQCLVNDLQLRAQLDDENNRIVNCSNGVYFKAKQTLEKVE